MNRLKENTFPKIEQNNNEWALNEPLSDVKIGEWSAYIIEQIYISRLQYIAKTIIKEVCP